VILTFRGNKFERSFVTLKAPPYGNGLNSFLFSISSPIIILNAVQDYGLIKTNLGCE
jgi:hypothetical protein